MTDKNEKNPGDLKSKIEAAKAKMKARGVEAPSVDVKAVRKTANDEKAKERAEKRAAAEAARTEKKTAREAKKAAKLAALAARKPHFKKLENAKAKLPVLSPADAELIANLVAAHNEAELTAIAENLRFMARMRQTERAIQVSTEVKPGDTVKIVNGDARHLGQTGKLTQINKIRCYVEVPGEKKPVYLFTSDIAPVA